MPDVWLLYNCYMTNCYMTSRCKGGNTRRALPSPSKAQARLAVREASSSALRTTSCGAIKLVVRARSLT